MPRRRTRPPSRTSGKDFTFNRRAGQMANKTITARPLDEARIALVRREPSPLRLDIATYAWYRDHGIPRAALDRALTIMVARGEAELSNDGRCILVRFLGPKK
jgi:hypothetical protein